MQIQNLLKMVIEKKGSDLFIATGNKPSIKINGEIMPIENMGELSQTDTEVLLLQTLSEKQKLSFENKLELDYAISYEKIGRFRVNTYVHKNGVGAAFRVIPAVPPKFDDLDLPEQILENVMSLKKGLVLITGPMGSGKTTTLASLVNKINMEQARHIVTIEDPIEYIYDSGKSIIEQREIGSHTYSFANALRSGLRQAADVILVGELRDLETISLALSAAETGSLVLATMHTAGASRTVDRMVDVFPAGQQNQVRSMLATSISTIVWQQLLPAVDGMKRIPACEILFANTAIAHLIRQKKTYQLQSVLETSRQEGMQTMQFAIDKLLSKGKISQEVHTEYMVALELLED